MGSRFSERTKKVGPSIRGGRGAIARRRSGLLLLAVLLAGCRPPTADPLAEAERRLDRAESALRTDLEGALRAASEALGRLPEALVDAGDDPMARFDALERLRRLYGLDGLLWKGPGEQRVWAGTPVVPRAIPAPPPWQDSSHTPPLWVHLGPYLRALVVGPRPILDGEAFATLVLDRQTLLAVTEPFAERWLEPLDLHGVELHPPGSEPPEDTSSRRRVLIRGPEGVALVAADLIAHDAEALAEQVQAHTERAQGIWKLAAWGGAALLALVLLLRFVRPLIWRGSALAVLVLLARQSLRHLPLADWFPILEEAFSPSEFAVPIPLGWLDSPADLALSASALLLALVALVHPLLAQRRSLRRRRAPLSLTGPKRLWTLSGVPLVALVSGGWAALVVEAVRGGRTPFFQAETLLPGLPVTLMLIGLVVFTAAALVLVRTLLAPSILLLRGRAGVLWRLVLGGLTAWGALEVSSALGARHGAAAAMPFFTALLVGRATEMGLALPSRALLHSVLATALVFPLMWTQVGVRDLEALGRVLQSRLDAEALHQTSVALSLQSAKEDERLRDALRRGSAGAALLGVAFDLWLRSDFRATGHPCRFTVLDARGGILDDFSHAAVPQDLLPAPEPPTGLGSSSPEDQVLVLRAEAQRLRCVVGRTRVRDAGGHLLGHVVLVVPDPLELALRGFGDLIPAEPTVERPLSSGQHAQYASLVDGVVQATSDPGVSRLPGGFGPDALATLGPETPSFSWQDANWQGYGLYNFERQLVYAIRRGRSALPEWMLALARVVLVGVGLGLAVSILCLLATLPRFRLRLQHKILLSYFVISVIPLVLLALASGAEAQRRFDRRLEERLDTDLERLRREVGRLGGYLPRDETKELQRFSPRRGHDVLLYRRGQLQALSRPELKMAELVSPFLPPEVHRATALEKRRILLREAEYAGKPVWLGYEPVLDSLGRTVATVGVPLVFDQDRMAEELTMSGSVLMAAYLLTLVLVLVGGIYAANNIARPIGLLADGTHRVAAGDLEVMLPTSGTDEMGELILNFNAMTRELRAATSRAVRAEREMAWRKMARQVAHEIKNPLTPMRLMVQQMLADWERNPEGAASSIRRASAVVLRQIEGLNRIASDFANFARMPRAQSVLVNPAALVRDVTALHGGTAAEGVVVRCEVQAGLVPILWDEEELRRALINLVRNGIQAIRGRGEVILRAFSAGRDGRAGVAISVTDSGVGIAPENRERLFEPHFSTKTSGMGLGLAIVRRIVEDSGGRIDVRSAVGRGTTFTLWWPAGAIPRRRFRPGGASKV